MKYEINIKLMNNSEINFRNRSLEEVEEFMKEINFDKFILFEHGKQKVGINTQNIVFYEIKP